MGRYRVEYDREGCIGAIACEAVFPDRWKVTEGKADLKDAKKNHDNTKQVLEIDEKELKLMKEAAESCPVNVIHIIDLKTGKKII